VRKSRKNGETFRAAFVRQSLNRLKDNQIMALSVLFSWSELELLARTSLGMKWECARFEETFDLT
jgi:hypothetical protein